MLGSIAARADLIAATLLMAGALTEGRKLLTGPGFALGPFLCKIRLRD